MKTIRKGLDEEIAEGFDWSDHLEVNEILEASTWTIDAGLTGSDATYDNFTTEIVLSGGTQNDTYKVQNEVTTSAGLVYEKSFKVLVVER